MWRAWTDYDNQFLTRALAAYAVHYLSGVDPAEAAKSITDGGDDNGIDAIFYHEPERRLFLVHQNGYTMEAASPQMVTSRSSLVVKDLFNMRSRDSTRKSTLINLYLCKS